MKKRNVILQAAVAAAFVAPIGVAMATGVISAPAAATKYAVESLTSTTDITLANIDYTLGVARTNTQDFTVSYTLPTGYVFNATPGNPTTSAASTCTLKRGGIGVNEVVYDCDVTAAGGETVGATIRLPTPQVRDVGTTALLGTAGNSISLQVKLTENGETACVDNIGTPTTCFLTASVASSQNGVDFATTAGGTALGVTQDSGNTTINVAATVPLAGFVVNATAPADTATIAAAAVILHDNVITGAAGATVEPDGATDYSMKVGDSWTYTVTDPTGFLGLTASKFCHDTDNDGTLCETGEVFSVSGNTATLTTTLTVAGAPNAARTISYQSDATTAMGTGRTLGVAGSVNVPGVDHALTGNSSWWVWASNGTQLQTPWFSNASGWLSRFVLTNTGTVAASYSTTCLAETGNTATLGASATGSIAANSQLVLTASDVCTFSGATRGAAVFTVNAPNANVQGTYTLVNATTGSSAVSNMMRPGTN